MPNLASPRPVEPPPATAGDGRPEDQPTAGRRRFLRLRRFLSRISIRLFAFNVLLVFVPAVGLFYLDVYEAQLREAQERSMVQQGRLLAAAIGQRGVLDRGSALEILERLEQRTQARLRVLDRGGSLLADSSAFGPRRDDVVTEQEVAEDSRSTQESWLYRLGALPFRIWDRLQPPTQTDAAEDFYLSSRPFDGAEIRDALEGRYGATHRISGGGQRSVTFYSAIPVRIEGDVVGVVLVSQSTFLILQDLYEVRLQIFKVFLASLGVAALLSLVLSTTIARPLQRLRRETAALLDRRGRLTGRFGHTTRLDEIGDLTRALRALASRLREHLGHLESYAGELSHEFKNPLASVRSATELLAETEDPAARQRFIRIVEGEVARMERLLSTLREVALIDLELEREERRRVVLNTLLEEVAEGWRLRSGMGVGIRLDLPEQPVTVEASEERLAQVVENLLDNAIGFAPVDSEVVVALGRDDGEVRLAVLDSGPGIPEENLGQIFNRFFSYRGDGARGEHTGLGLAIVKAIVEGYGGRVGARNRPEGGAAFEVRLRADSEAANEELELEPRGHENLHE